MLIMFRIIKEIYFVVEEISVRSKRTFERRLVLLRFKSKLPWKN